MGLARHLLTYPLADLIRLQRYLQRYAWIASKVKDGMNITEARKAVIREQNLRPTDLPCARQLSGMCKRYLSEAACFVFGTEEMPLLCVRDGRGEAKGLTDEGLLFLAEVLTVLEHLRTRAHLPLPR